MKKAIIWTGVIIAIYLLISGIDAYRPALKTITGVFAGLYSALTNPPREDKR